jgi:hypothetical protein
MPLKVAVPPLVSERLPSVMVSAPWLVQSLPVPSMLIEGSVPLPAAAPMVVVPAVVTLPPLLTVMKLLLVAPAASTTAPPMLAREPAPETVSESSVVPSAVCRVKAPEVFSTPPLTTLTVDGPLAVERATRVVVL